MAPWRSSISRHCGCLPSTLAISGDICVAWHGELISLVKEKTWKLHQLSWWPRPSCRLQRLVIWIWRAYTNYLQWNTNNSKEKYHSELLSLWEKAVWEGIMLHLVTFTSLWRKKITSTSLWKKKINSDITDEQSYIFIKWSFVFHALKFIQRIPYVP